MHLSDEHRSQEGRDFHGRRTDLLWFCISRCLPCSPRQLSPRPHAHLSRLRRRDRIVLICLLIANLASQFANQGATY